jgi:hypothetical protein
MMGNWPVGPDLELPMYAALANGRYLYGAHWQRIFADPEIRAAMRKKFDQLARRPLLASAKQVDDATIHEALWPHAFPFADISVYGNRVYTASPEGLFVYDWVWEDIDDTRTPIAGERRWDAPLMAIETGYGTIAMAAGDAGLFELPVDDYAATSIHPRDPDQRLSTHTSDLHWMYYSVLGSSRYSGGALASFRRATGEDAPREFDRVLTPSEIFAGEIHGESELTPGYLWGAQDKLYWAHAGDLLAMSYHPGRRQSSQFDALGSVRKPAGDVISAKAATYGSVVETMSNLNVYASNGQSYSTADEPVNWRAFPRSLRYLNQLHIVFEDRLEIWAFTHDFLVDQEVKTLGTRFSERDPRQRRSRQSSLQPDRQEPDEPRPHVPF